MDDKGHIVASLGCMFFFFNGTATTEIYTLSLRDALPILASRGRTDAKTEPLILVTFPSLPLTLRQAELLTLQLQGTLETLERLFMQSPDTMNPHTVVRITWPLPPQAALVSHF